MKLVKDHELEIVSQNMEISCEMILGVRQSLEATIDQKLKDLHEINVISSS
jgi:hypothetical protein